MDQLDGLIGRVAERNTKPNSDLARRSCTAVLSAASVASKSRSHKARAVRRSFWLYVVWNPVAARKALALT